MKSTMERLKHNKWTNTRLRDKVASIGNENRQVLKSVESEERLGMTKGK